MRFKLINEDITRLDYDAIVNAANTELQMGGGVCGAIFKAAGPKNLEEACNKLAPIKTGEAVITPAFNLKAKYIIHTAGPVYNPQKDDECEKLLSKCYENSLKIAGENDIKSIAFPLISAGIYGYPRRKAYEIAKKTIEYYLETHTMDVYLTILDQQFIDEINNDI